MLPDQNQSNKHFYAHKNVESVIATWKKDIQVLNGWMVWITHFSRSLTRTHPSKKTNAIIDAPIDAKTMLIFPKCP
jgi:hypothetical protein